jgi:uncharacterized phage infection (PIP) family protein YhgE
MASNSARPESGISENLTSQVSDKGMQNASVTCWKQIDTIPPAAKPTCDSTKGLQPVEIYDSKPGCENKTPTASVPDLKNGSDKFSSGAKEIQDALTALKSGDKCGGKEELKDAIKFLNDGMKDVRNGVGGDFDLSKLPESNPLHRVGSGRQAIKRGRSDLESALAKLDDPNADMDCIVKDIENGLLKVRGGSSNISKATGLVEEGRSDHRPKVASDTAPADCKDSNADAPEPKSYPKLLHVHEDHTGLRHVDKSIGNLSESLEEMNDGDYKHARRELQGTLKQIPSATKDLNYAFGGATPGQDQFVDANSDVFKALNQFDGGNFDEAMKTIRTALKALKEGRGQVHDASVVNVDA